ncbi:acyl-CoA thioesterase [Bradyrhizobium mercantei]|uniref:acyl-CoA thioesterase n=1 Tax=Bradyrhizobium mercantei TaxID=1904807 RepID=UPI000977C75A|nr:thioesterase family protein [Bradyrhizobium mercantei]
MSAYSYYRRLNWSECDPGGIVFFPNYAKWAVDGLNEMLQSDGYIPNRKLPDGGTEGIPCVEFNMRFFDAPLLHAMVSHQISVQRVGKTSFTIRHCFSGDGRSFADALDTRVWAVHGEHGLRKSPLPPEVLEILNARKQPETAE